LEDDGGGRENAILPDEGRYSTLQVLHDSFYHGPICHYIDNCLGSSATRTVIHDMDVANSNI
jgi:hypothetical protein